MKLFKKKPRYEIKSGENINESQQNELNELFELQRVEMGWHPPSSSLCLLEKGKLIAGIKYEFNTATGVMAVFGAATAPSHKTAKEFFNHFHESPLNRLFFVLLAKAKRNKILYIDALASYPSGKRFIKRLEEKGIVKIVTKPKKRGKLGHLNLKILEYRKPLTFKRRKTI